MKMSDKTLGSSIKMLQEKNVPYFCPKAGGGEIIEQFHTFVFLITP